MSKFKIKNERFTFFEIRLTHRVISYLINELFYRWDKKYFLCYGMDKFFMDEDNRDEVKENQIWKIEIWFRKNKPKYANSNYVWWTYHKRVTTEVNEKKLFHLYKLRARLNREIKRRQLNKHKHRNENNNLNNLGTGC